MAMTPGKTFGTSRQEVKGAEGKAIREKDKLSGKSVNDNDNSNKSGVDQKDIDATSKDDDDRYSLQDFASSSGDEDVRVEHGKENSQPVKDTDSLSVDSSLQRDSTYVKPEPSFVADNVSILSGKTFQKAKKRRESLKGEQKIQTSEKDPEARKSDNMSYDPSMGSGSGGGKKEQAGNDSVGTIEDVASNFMLRVERIETENGRLLDDNQRLLGKMKTADETEERLMNEIHVLKREQDELTVEYNKVKDENSSLLKRLADVNKEKEAQRKVFEEENSDLREDLRLLEEDKAKTKKIVRDMESNMQELSDRTVEFEMSVKSLRDELEKLRDEKEMEARNGEKEKLQAAVKQKEELIDALKEELQNMDKEREGMDVLKNQAKLTQEQLEECQGELENKDKYIDSLDKEKAILVDELAKLRASLKDKTKDYDDLKKKKDNLSNSKKSLEKTVNELNVNIEKLKEEKLEALAQARGEDTENLEAELADLKNKISIMKTTEKAMSDLLMSKQNHIADLRTENAELRNVNKIQKQDMDELRHTLEDKAVVTDKYADIVDTHKRILDENKRLKTLMTTKAIEEKNASTEQAEMEVAFENVENKLARAQKRIVQLETWMDDIYSGQEYEMIPKNGISRGSILSLPEIPLPDTTRSKKSTGRQTNRRSNRVQRFNATSLDWAQ